MDFFLSSTTISMDCNGKGSAQSLWVLEHQVFGMLFLVAIPKGLKQTFDTLWFLAPAK